MIAEILLADPGDEATYSIDWSDALGEGVTLSSVAHSVPSPLTLVQESTDAQNNLSLLRIAGARHGDLYMIEAEATLSTGEKLNRQFPLRGFNG